ncbi:hypothetical protein VOLCADRAFT_97117 [Volvox carteri f. nagariensis]|uniref:Methyltransferase type 11 domain-containing protein n=1 Tax=Volvox carteri f. nagariensis TaxID=3068 RepID=D8UBX8_VOLCA|nr:uncharacterized protein VOLCADRAFT_97117 [Volvox carteri f. nagariensis]EFJ42696.1 hypothetical protein VOLCADRAFT_97117 [Volvox carteri f. nagariensis]|eukprot:XP_002956157.1 hypothetical protein VOLCADRAFT_97117 [Volvox carteri f. nagariensis]
MAAAAIETGAVRPTYSASAYWDTRYMGPAKNFDWFFNYPALKALLREYLPTGRVLHVGCGNSNIQEGMAADGFTVTNVDISPVVIEQMKHKHADIQTLDYMVADCRDMPQLENGSFQSCIDKGTLDAVLCSQSGQVDAVKYLHEIDRLLQPSGKFLLISLGAPAARLSLLHKQLWDGVQVLLLPKPLLYLQSDVTLTGRALPSHCAADKDQPIEALGPWPASEAVQELATRNLDTRDYFFAYICTKPPTPIPSPQHQSPQPESQQALTLQLQQQALQLQAL